MSRWSPGIRLRLVLLVAAAAGPSLVLSLVRAKDAAETRRADAERQAMSEARRLASEIAADLARQDTLLTALARTIRPVAVAERENNRLLDEAHRLRGRPDEVYIVVDREGWVVGRSNADSLPARISVADRDFFRQVMSTGAGAIGAPVRLRPTLKYFGVSIAHPVTGPDGRPAGLVAVTMRLTAIGTLLDDSGLPPGSVITLRDSGIVIARSKDAERYVGQRAGTDTQVSLRLPDGMREDTWLDGERRLTAWTMVPGTGRWQLIVGIPTSAMMSSVAAARAELVFFLMVFVAGLVAAALIARSITRPIGELVADADALARGERVHADPPGPRDLALLADAFNTMSDRVAERTEALRAAEARARVLFAQSPLPMLVVDGTALTVIDANEAAATLLGWSRADLVGRTVESLRPPEDVPRWRTMMASLGDGVTHLGQWRYVTSRGHLLDVELVTARTTL
ncbi:MAG: PAS domain-containing protein, partial [Gemmatimonadaceae bacterium]|nr:PAS domain-containing protein [Gemmatimonadaceae bacterium]